MKRAVMVLLLLAWLTPAVLVAVNRDDYRRTDAQLAKLRRTRRTPRGKEYLQLEVVAGVSMGSMVVAVVLLFKR